ncbi:sensor histidine kinase [Sulfurihydrogenibium azorense]|uniref:sensor histidine kinase n=1 Tax=Sulfurihydrogenibium azorense TaxID=309806 RepID=UPI00240A1DB8|nr:ATP-binding protein [Sulfurihydrogenibium azorense]MDM7273319.1 ATP-binding protein [Sulfurihydrogenibium azorense]
MNLEKDKTKRNLIIFLVSFILFLGGNYYIFNKLEKVKDVLNPYIFLFILNIDVIFFIIIFASLLRYIIKIFFQEGIKGKLRLKLTVILVLMIIIPSMILFTVSVSIISSATNLWFSGKVGNALSKLDTIVTQNITSNQEWVYKIYTSIKEGVLKPKDAVDFLGLRTVAINDSEGRLLEFYGKPYDREILNALGKEGFITYENKIVYQNILDSNRKILLVYELPKDIILSKEDTALILEIYNQLKFYKTPIRIGYILILLTITISVIFAAFWLSRFIITNITKPLEALVDASKRISEGDLSVKIDLKAQDEFGILIEEFNKMVDRLNLLYKKLEERNNILRKNKEYLEAILNNIRAGVVYSSEDGKVENINLSAKSILGEDVERFKRKHIKDFANEFKLDLSNEKEQIVEINGKTLLVKITNISKEGYVIVFDDITDIISAQKLKMWKEVAQRIAHEIKNPLTPIKLSAERIINQWKKKNPNIDQIIEKATSVIISETEHLSQLVKEFNQFGLSFSEFEKEIVDLCQLLNETAESYIDERFKVEIECQYKPFIKGNKKLLKQAFSNIIQNSYEEADYLKITVKLQENSVLILFEDNGRGITKEDLDKVFLPYYSKKPKGSGLGLAITKEIIENHNGEIQALESSKGAKFLIKLKEE